ncbi:MAG TPA: hypothetical protein VE685_11580, partial [Thermoanaerobaculia bacterium]|nr:hypothetical protein [Thermoanaerobaculia bacterium]
MPIRRLQSLMALVLTVFAVCAGPAQAAEDPRREPRSIDQDFLEMEREVPGFGGFFYDEQDRLNVFLKDTEGPEAAAFREVEPGVIIRRGDYGFAELAAWRRELRQVLALPGVVSLEVDEATNRIRIGMDSRARTKSLDRDRLERELLFKSAPREAIVVEEAEPIRPMVNLRDKVRPIAGGFEVANFKACTLGFNVFREGVFGFVTNSHCTSRQGGLEETRFYQNYLASGGEFVGVEVADPDYFTGGECPAGRRCRFSDSSFIQYDAANLGDYGKLARTVSRGAANGSLEIAGKTPRFTINGRATSVRGKPLNKIGRTTGWTFGNVVATCVDVNVAGTDFSQFCQDVVQAGVGPGDSGSPVFSWTKGNNVKLVGILWGGGTTVFVLSPLANVEQELGALEIHPKPTRPR